MKALGKSGTLINVSRGSVVDEKALIKALQTGTLGSAGLDVFEAEPCVPNELKNMIKVSKKNPKCIISADRWISQKGFYKYGIIKFLANFFFQKLIKIFFKYKILDFTFAYRLYPKNALKGYKINELRHGFALEILLSPMKRGFKVITLPAKWKKRVEGRSSITIDSYFSYLRVLFRNI